MFALNSRSDLRSTEYSQCLLGRVCVKSVSWATGKDAHEV